jgi:hypothetical protein
MNRRSIIEALCALLAGVLLAGSFIALCWLAELATIP